MAELVFNLMHLLLEAAHLSRKGADVQVRFYLLECIDFKLFKFEFKCSKRQMLLI